MGSGGESGVECWLQTGSIPSCRLLTVIGTGRWSALHEEVFEVGLARSPGLLRLCTGSQDSWAYNWHPCDSTHFLGTDGMTSLDLGTTHAPHLCWRVLPADPACSSAY